jgi:hypothetical protein
VQPQEPANPTPAAVTDAVEAEPRSTEAQESQPQPSLWNRLFGGSKKEAKAGDAPANEDAAEATDESSTLTLSKTELDRRVQAETDRREAKRQREEADRKARELRESAEREARERQELIERKLTPGADEYDPYEGAEERARLKAENDAAEKFTGLFQTVSQQHDANTLDVLVAALPENERERIFKIDGAGVGLEGRRLIVDEGLKALQRHWKAEGQREAEQKLREDPIFRKRVFTEHRDQVDEPELVVGTGGSTRGDPFMDQIFSDYRAAKGRRS